MSAINSLAEQDFEQLSIQRTENGLASIIAVHDTTLGPALGGVRIRKYESDDAAAADAMRLARAMTYKAALAGLALGGGKSVINADPRSEKTRGLLEAHGRHIALLGGRYIPGADMGTGPADLKVIAEHAPRVSSDGRDPSPYTARGVVASISAVATHLGRDGVDGLRVAVQGAGNVGLGIVKLLTAGGATVLVADPDPERVRLAVEDFGAQASSLEEILHADVDVVCPAGPGLVIDERTVDRLKAVALVGAANNMLASPEAGAALIARGIVHVPDFVSNAGGLISCDAELNGLTDFVGKVDRIGDVVIEILDRARATGVDSSTVAIELAERRIAEVRAA